MGSTTPFGRVKCTRNALGKVCTCQEWDPSEEDASLCDCCHHHMSFHEPCHPVTSGYGRCMSKFDDAGSSYDDGCQEFFPPRPPNSKKCAGCGCHRGQHKPVGNAAGERPGPSNVQGQEQQFPSSDSSTSFIQIPGSKRIEVDSAIISTEADSEPEGAVRCGDVLQLEKAVIDLGNRADHRFVLVMFVLTATLQLLALQHYICHFQATGLRASHPGLERTLPEDLPNLEPKHKVFLSHSGVQKDFVEQLCIDLERRDRCPFFDKRRSSLPVGAKFPPLIFDAIQQCEVGVVVLSEDFFTRTKWPMLELVEMVRTSKKSEGRMIIVPVFFRITREECRKGETLKRWIPTWEEWARMDKSFNIKEWKAALRIFGSTTGLSLQNGEVQLRAEVVDAVCAFLMPESRWDDSHVEGKDRLCKVIMERLVPKDSTAGVRVIGVYGVGGLGKTTLCMVLCNKLFKEFRGRVFHTEMKSGSEVELFRKVLRTLTDTQHNLLDGMDIDKWRDQLKRCVVRQPVFLAIDNVDDDSAQQAKTYLEARHSFYNGSIILVTSRSLNQLKALNIPEDECLGMPELMVLEAKALFRNHAASIGDGKLEVKEEVVCRCVKMCCFRKGDGVSHHYLPLALKVLGNELREQLGCNNFDSKLMEDKLSSIEECFEVLETKKQIFEVLRISYDTLHRDDQMIFMDVALLVDRVGTNFGFGRLNLFEWLCTVHGESSEEVMRARLNKLKKKSLLEEVGDGSRVMMHDLWHEFCVAETKVGKFADRRWVYCEGECNEVGGSSPGGRCWENVERMVFSEEAFFQKFPGLCLDYFLNVKALKVGIGESSRWNRAWTPRIPAVVELGKLRHLKHLELNCRWGLPTWVPPLMKFGGLGLLRNLAFLRWVKVPAEEQYAEDIGCLTNLQYLTLFVWNASRLPDMSQLTSLRVALFLSCNQVEMISGLSSKLRNLRCLNLYGCVKLRCCPGVGDLIGLEILDLSYCSALEELPSLGKLTNLEELNLSGCGSLRVCPGLCGLRSLRILDVSGCSQLRTLPSLSDLVSLEELRASCCYNLAELPDVRNLGKLRVLSIRKCPIRTMSGFEGLGALRNLSASFESLGDWPDLHEFASLRCVDIEGWSGPGLTSIAQHAMLESLRVVKCNESVEVLELSCLPRFRELVLSECRALQSVALGSARLTACSRLDEVSDLSNFLGLEELHLEKCESLTRIMSQEPLPTLHRLTLRDCGSLEALPDLSYFLHLINLDLRNCESLASLNITEPLVALEEVHLHGCKGLEALPDLSYFPSVRELDLESCECLTRITSQKCLPTLETLMLGDCRSLEALPDLSYFLHLKVLDLENCESLESLNITEPVIALEVVGLHGCKGLEALPDLSYFPSVRELTLEGCGCLTRIMTQGPLPALKKLMLRNCQSLEALPDLSYFLHLIDLDLENCESLASLNITEPLVTLEVVGLHGCKGLVALPDLSYFPSVQKLNLQGCGRLTRIMCQVPLPAFETLMLRDCQNLEALPDLSYFLHLKVLDLENCESLESLNITEPVIALEVVGLHGCKGLEALPDLSYFPSVRELTL